MAYRLVYSEFWKDPKVLEEMTPEDRYFYLYVLTNPCTTSCGIYQITRKQMAFELGYSRESIDSLMNRFEEHHKLIKYNTETRELAVKNWGRYNLNKGGKPVIDCLTKELSQVKDVSLISYLKETIRSKTILELYERFDGTLTNRERNVPRQGDNTNTNTNTSTNTSTDTKIDSNYVNFFSNNFHLITPYEKQLLESYEKDGIEAGAIILALEKAISKNKRNIEYVKGILNNWLKNNIKSISDVEAAEKEFKRKKAGENSGSNRKDDGNELTEQGIGL